MIDFRCVTECGNGVSEFARNGTHQLEAAPVQIIFLLIVCALCLFKRQSLSWIWFNRVYRFFVLFRCFSSSIPLLCYSVFVLFLVLRVFWLHRWLWLAACECVGGSDWLHANVSVALIGCMRTVVVCLNGWARLKRAFLKASWFA